MYKKCLYSFLLIASMAHASILREMEHHTATHSEFVDFMEHHLDAVADETHVVGFHLHIIKKDPQAWQELFEYIVQVMRSQDEAEFQEHLQVLASVIGNDKFHGKIEMKFGDKDEVAEIRPDLVVE